MGVPLLYNKERLWIKENFTGTLMLRMQKNNKKVLDFGK